MSLVRFFLSQADTICDTSVNNGGGDALTSRKRIVTRRLVLRALLVRVFFLVAMGVSCRLLPDFGGGDESVVTFDLRVDSDCFATRGSFCHSTYLGKRECSWNETTDDCFLTKTDAQSTSFLQRRFYPFLLTPLTRWDASRFLRLAHTPQLYSPRRDRDTVSYTDSEQAHAFFPLFPTAIRAVAWLLLQCLPSVLLPATCEQTLVLAAWLLNTCCFCLSSACLFQLTHELLVVQPITHKKLDDVGDQRSAPIVWATRTTLLFLINPANVFFGTAYSESLFWLMVLVGCSMKDAAKDRFAPLTLTAMIYWYLAASVRSNGVLCLGYLLLADIGSALDKKNVWILLRGIATVTVGLRITLQSHNIQGSIRHCYKAGDGHSRGVVARLLNLLPDSDQAAEVRPEWCHDAQTQGSIIPFDLYAYVQRKYWNVGVLRYFAVKQLPNFLLAAPIIIIAACGVATWIQSSWTRFNKQQTGTGPSQRVLSRRIIGWAVDSLQSFSKHVSGNQLYDFYSYEDVLTGSNQVLGHYAVLCIAALLGLFVAHVQITTRLLCSTCPALYWYMTVLVSRKQRKHHWVGEAIVKYCLLYNLLGIIMHPSWLPWT